MKTLLFTLFSLQFLANLQSQKLNEKYSFSESDYYDYEKKEKYPSKCDCDYIENTLILKKDSTFQLTEQVGRLDPKYTIIKGNWRIHNDSTLILSGQYMEGGMFINNVWADSFMIRNIVFKDGYVQSYYIWDGERNWNGIGDPLFEKKKKK